MPEKYLVLQESEGTSYHPQQSDKKMNNAKKGCTSSKKTEIKPEVFSLSSSTSKKAFNSTSQPSLLSSPPPLHSSSSPSKNVEKPSKRISKTLQDEANSETNAKESHGNYLQDVHEGEVVTPHHCLQKKRSSGKQKACSSNDGSHNSPWRNNVPSTHCESISLNSTTSTTNEYEKVNPLVVSSSARPAISPFTATDASFLEKKRERGRYHDDNTAYFTSCRAQLSSPSSLSSILFPVVLRLLGWKVHTFLSNGEKDGKSALFSFLRHSYCHHFMKDFLPEEAEKKSTSSEKDRKIVKRITANTMKTTLFPSDVVMEEQEEVVKKEKNPSPLTRSKNVRRTSSSPLHDAAPSSSATPSPAPFSLEKPEKEGKTICSGSEVAFSIVHHVHHVCDVIQGIVSAPSLLESALRKEAMLRDTTTNTYVTHEKEEDEMEKERKKTKRDRSNGNTERLSAEEIKRDLQDDTSSASSFPSFILFQHVSQPFTQVLCRLSPSPSLSSSPSSFAYLLGEVDLSVPPVFPSSVSRTFTPPTSLGPSLFPSPPLSDPLLGRPPPVFPSSPCPSSTNTMDTAIPFSTTPRFLTQEEVVEVFATRAMWGTTAGRNRATAFSLSSSSSTPSFRRVTLMDVPYPCLASLVSDRHATAPQKEAKASIRETAMTSLSTRHPTAPPAATTCVPPPLRVGEKQDATCSAPHHCAFDIQTNSLFHAPASPLSSSPAALPEVPVEKEDRGSVLLTELFFMQEKKEEENQRHVRRTNKGETKRKKGEEGKEMKKEEEEAVKRQPKTMTGSADAVKQQQQEQERGRRSLVVAESLDGRAGVHDDVPSEKGKDSTKEGKKKKGPPAAFSVTTHSSSSSSVSSSTLLSPSRPSSPLCTTPSLGTLQHISGFTVNDTQSAVSLAHTRHFLRCCAEEERKEKQYIASLHQQGFSLEAWTTPATHLTLPVSSSPYVTSCSSLPSPPSRKRSRSSSSCSSSVDAPPLWNAAAPPSSLPVPEEAIAPEHKDGAEENKKKGNREKDARTAFHALVGYFFFQQRQQQDALREEMWKNVQHATHRLTVLQMAHQNRRQGIGKEHWARHHEVEEEDSEEEEDEEEKTRWKDLAQVPLGTLSIADVLYASVQTQLEANTEEGNYYQRHHPLSLSSSLSFPTFPPVPPRTFLTTGGVLSTWRHHLISSSTPPFPASLSSSRATEAVAVPSSSPHALKTLHPSPDDRCHHWREILPKDVFPLERIPVLDDIPLRGTWIPAPTSVEPIPSTSSSSSSCGHSFPSFPDASSVSPPHDRSLFLRPLRIPSLLCGVTYAGRPEKRGDGWDMRQCRRPRVEQDEKRASCRTGAPEEGDGRSHVRGGQGGQVTTVRLWGPAQRAEVPPSSAGKAEAFEQRRKRSEEENTGRISSDRAAPVSCFPPFSIVENPEEDVRYFVHRRYMSKNMKEQMDREHTEDAGRSSSTSSPFSSGRSKRYHEREVQKERREEEQEGRASVSLTSIDSMGTKKETKKTEGKLSVPPLSTAIRSLDDGGTISAGEKADGNRQAMSDTEPVLEALKQKGGVPILPIPMPDVEWRYH